MASDSSDARGLFPALLKHWRRRRALSQLDLALAAGVSARHISFLETARSTPSAPMVLRLGTVLDVPLRHINAMLRAAGHPGAYPDAEDQIPDEVAHALALMKRHHEPYPLVVVGRCYDILEYNGAAQRLFELAVPGLPLEGLNLARLCFDPAGAQPLIANFDEVGPALLWRLQREVLASPNDAPLAELLDAILRMPSVQEDWREVDLSVPSLPALTLHLRAGPMSLRFMIMVTALQSPQTVALDEIRIESWFPMDEDTRRACEALRQSAK